MSSYFSIYTCERCKHLVSIGFIGKELSTGQKFNRVKEGSKIEMKVKDDITEEIKTKAKNALR